MNNLAWSGGDENDRACRYQGMTVIELLVVIAIIAVLIAFLLPSVRTAGPAARRGQCKNNLKQIGLALHNYHHTYGTFPPACTVDEEGRPLHSWRTLILPFLKQKPLYDSIDLTKPWDDPVNTKAYQTSVPFYQCSESANNKMPAHNTAYLAVATNSSALRPGESLSLFDIAGGTSETLLVIEVDAESSVPWMSPHDASESLILSFGPKKGLPHEGGLHGLFVDGGVRFLAAEMPTDQRRVLISADSGDRDATDVADN